MTEIVHGFDNALGLGTNAKNLAVSQMFLRAIIVFVSTLTMLRLGDRRFLTNRSAFDAALGFILASMLARAVNGTAAFFPTLLTGFFLIGLHKLFAFLTRRPSWFSNLVKGRPVELIRQGKIDRA